MAGLDRRGTGAETAPSSWRGAAPDNGLVRNPDPVVTGGEVRVQKDHQGVPLAASQLSGKVNAPAGGHHKPFQGRERLPRASPLPLAEGVLPLRRRKSEG